MTDFSSKVIALVKSIPRGKVATYSQVAALAGKPHAARGVSWVLNSSSGTYQLPWHRVLNSKGRISFPSMSKNYRKQKGLLESEGIQFAANDVIDLSKFQWKKQKKAPRSSLRQPRLFS